MDWAGILTAAATIVTALGGLELIKFLLNRKSNRKITEANAFDVAQSSWAKEHHRMQDEITELNKKVDDLYDKVHQLESERLDLINENNSLRLQLKEAEKHVCLQPDDRCLQRLNPEDKCRLRKLLRGEYIKDNPGAIITEEDMKRKPDNVGEVLCVPAGSDNYSVKID